MAHFRATIQGQRGVASRLGSPKSRIKASINGWNAGVKVIGYVNDRGQDEFLVYLTGGSNDSSEKLVTIIANTPEGPDHESFA